MLIYSCPDVGEDLTFLAASLAGSKRRQMDFFSPSLAAVDAHGLIWPCPCKLISNKSPFGGQFVTWKMGSCLGMSWHLFLCLGLLTWLFWDALRNLSLFLFFFWLAKNRLCCKKVLLGGRASLTHLELPGFPARLVCSYTQLGLTPKSSKVLGATCGGFGGLVLPVWSTLLSFCPVGTWVWTFNTTPSVVLPPTSVA